jgi:hypothetical protein
MAQVYACDIHTYELSVGRSSAGSGPSFGRTWERFIKLNLNPGRFGNRVTVAELAFFEEPGHIDNTKNGVRSDSLVKIFIPISDFSDVYKVLRTERPLTLLWQQLEPGSNLTSINSWRITTSREPIAEGDSEI